MGRIAYIPFDDSVTTDADQDIIEILAGSANKFILHYFELTSAATTAESVNIRLLRRSTTGSGGSAITVVAADEDGGTINLTANRLVTTPGTAGAVFAEWYWEQLGPLVFQPTPEIMPIVQENGGRLCIHLGTALAGTTSWAGYAVVEEL